MKTLVAVYDLAVSPPTYDFFSFLCAAEKARIDGGFENIDLIFQPGPKGGFRDDDLPPDLPMRQAMFQRICVAGARLLPSVSDVVQFGQRTAVEAEFPAPYDYQHPEPFYGTFLIKHVPRALRASAHARRENATRFYDPYVTITIREADYWPARNSNMKEWAAVDQGMQRRGYRVVWIPDAANAGTGYGLAAWDIDLRLAAYEGAVCNFGVSNGPMVLLYMSNAPYLVFKMIEPSSVSATAEFLASHGMTEGSQFGPNGSLVWKDDTADVILAAFDDGYSVRSRVANG